MLVLINNFRESRGREWLEEDATQTLWCLSHSIEMANRGELCSAGKEFLNGWEEIVGITESGLCPASAEKRLFNQFIENPDNSTLILSAHQIGCGVIHYKKKVYGTIRVRRT